MKRNSMFAVTMFAVISLLSVAGAQAQDGECTLNPDGTTSNCGDIYQLDPQQHSDEIDQNDGSGQDDSIWGQLLASDSDYAPNEAVSDTQVFTFSSGPNGTVTATVNSGTVRYSVTTLFTGRVQSVHPAGSSITGRDRNGNGRPDILEAASRQGTLTHTPAGSTKKKPIVVQK